MSSFVKKLKETTRGGGRTLGFGAVNRAATPPMLLVAAISHVDEDLVKLAVSNEVDALLFYLKDPTGRTTDITNMVSPDSKIPWGVHLPKADLEGVTKLAEAGCDFIIMDFEAAPHVLQEEAVGKVLEVDSLIEDSLLRSIGKLSVDALFYVKDKPSGPLNIGLLLNYHRLTGFSGKSIILHAPRDFSELSLLRGAGVSAIIMDLSGKDAQSRMKEAREAIRKISLENRKKPKDEEMNALLPHSGSVDEIDSEY